MLNNNGIIHNSNNETVDESIWTKIKEGEKK